MHSARFRPTGVAAKIIANTLGKPSQDQDLLERVKMWDDQDSHVEDDR